MTIQDVLAAASQLSQAERLQVAIRLLESLKESYSASTSLDNLDEQDQLSEERVDYEQWLTETRPKVEVALQQIERGEVLDSETVINRLQEKLDQARSKDL